MLIGHQNLFWTTAGFCNEWFGRWIFPIVRPENGSATRRSSICMESVFFGRKKQIWIVIYEPAQPPGTVLVRQARDCNAATHECRMTANENTRPAVPATIISLDQSVSVIFRSQLLGESTSSEGSLSMGGNGALVWSSVDVDCGSTGPERRCSLPPQRMYASQYCTARC